jgi:integrase/recombinase XerD
MESASERDFKRKYQSHLKHLKLKGMQPKTIDAYSRALRRIGARFKFRIDDLSEKQLTDYFTELLQSHLLMAARTRAFPARSRAFCTSRTVRRRA